MNNVGLLYVGAVLLVNGLMLLGRVPARSAAALNLFVGGLQCVTPTVLIIQAHGDSEAILGASGLFLFGFTYLYVGIANLAGLEPEGIGWFSLFVAGAAIVYAGLAFWRQHDPVFGVIWLSWALLWGLFFLVLGLGREELTRFTGWTTVLLSQPTCTLPAFLALTGGYRSTTSAALIAAAAAVLLVALAAVLGFRGQPRSVHDRAAAAA
ncbi:AmiS/UreI family transporter [Amycolatopsis echigonensis]|uniref:AmiS/UreI family transporter n=1 Tax=Amycolatopsis echigonensis TaxID=2576905 RepID=A0A2N3WZX9_9PSEU|nr:AmiS/UreI family transporter [Amycolatopsis niigatensis]PKV99443.1 AmiS/UreI family transporter [Amycolatopsis niigatensis]